MNAEGLLKVYEQISEAPDAVARLRRFVLDLAVRGKLVEQDARDEPAKSLLEKLPDLKASLVERASLRKPKSLLASIIDEDDTTPPGWAVVQGSDLFLTRSGNSKLIKGKQHSEARSNLFPGFSAAGQDVWLEHWEHEGIAAILSAVGARCGKAFLAEGRWSAIANTHIVWLIPEITAPNFAMLLLNDEDFWTRSGGAQPFVKVKETLARPFPLPPLAEQHRIVTKVDELMGLCDRLEAAREAREEARDKLTAASLARLTAPDAGSTDTPDQTTEVSGATGTPHAAPAVHTHARFALDALPALTSRPDQIKTLRQTILNLAVRGKLVEQDPADEPARELLDRIADKRAELVKSGEAKKLKPRKDESWPFEIPASWVWSSLGALSSLITKGSSPKWQGIGYVEKDAGLLFITSENVGNFRLRKLDELKYVEARFKDVEPRSMLAKNDILINLVGASIGRTAIYDLNDEANINQAVALVRMTDPIQRPSLNYLLRYLNSDLAVDLMLGSRVTTAQPNISLADVNGFPIPLPPLAEQHRIVAKVDALMALCDKLEAALTATDTTRTRLLNALLHEALTPATPIPEAAE